MLEIGSVIGGKYRILAEIGHGGMSTVYLALNEKANKQWAVKEVRTEGGNAKDKDVIRQNLIAETSILRELRHPHLPTIIDIIQEDDSYLILMDYIEGKTLAKKLDKEGAQKEEDVVKWSMQICDVLGYLHSQDPKIIYRDTKPSNIMLKPNGDVVLIDFGTARVYKETSEEDTSWLGTRGYAAPEQFGGRGQTDERTDIYNLGATMYHLITGHNPGRPPYEMYPIRKWDSSLSSGLEYIIQKCTKPNPDERYQSCADLMYALENYKELDEDVIRKQKRQLAVFLSMLICSATCFIGSGLTGHAANVMTNETYSAYIRNAQSASKDDKVARYKEAIHVDATQEQAYDELLEQLLSDENFSKKDADIMQEVLMTPNGDRTNEDILKTNRSAYDDLVYKLGLAYFYYYDRKGNKTMAKPWFAIAKDGEIEQSKKDRAQRFYKISEYYDSLSLKNKAGDNQVSYKDYWEDLKSLTTGNLVEEDNERTALVMYKEVLYQVIMHASKFAKAGVPMDDMNAALDDIHFHLETDFDSYTDEDGILKEMQVALREAYSAVETAYGGAK